MRFLGYVALCFLLGVLEVGAYQLFWTREAAKTIVRYQSLTDTRSIIANTTETPRGVTVSPLNETVFYGQIENPDSIIRITYSGGSPTVVPSSSGGYRGLTTNQDSTLIYGADLAGNVDSFSTVTLTKSTLFSYTLGRIGDVALAEGLGRIYFTDSQNGDIYYRNIDGSGSSTLIYNGGAFEANYIAVDESVGKVFWTADIVDSRMRSSNLDGSNVQVVVDFSTLFSGGRGEGIALDTENQLLYVADSLNGNIYSMNYDGTNTQVVQSGQSGVHGLAFIPEFSGSSAVLGLIVGALVLFIALRRKRASS